jgi:hypothetical protein
MSLTGWKTFANPRFFIASASAASRKSTTNTFVLTSEYLRRFNPDFEEAIAVDVISMSALLQAYAQ